MEWLIIDTLRTKDQNISFVITQCGKLKTITKAKSAHKINKGDIFTPTLNATYYINNNKSRTVEILSCVSFSADAWAALKRT